MRKWQLKGGWKRQLSGKGSLIVHVRSPIQDFGLGKGKIVELVWVQLSL